MKEGINGVSSETPKRILFGPGTYHKGLKREGSNWNFKESCIGATNGGGSLKIEPEFTDIEIDGVYVPVKGLSKQKTGEKATMEINPLELTKDIMKAATIGKETAAEDASFDLIESKPEIETGDYWENIAFVGKTLAGKPIIAIMDNALCTSGLGVDPANKQAANGKYTFECHADLEEDGEMNTLPWRIYYPKEV